MSSKSKVWRCRALVNWLHEAVILLLPSAKMCIIIIKAPEMLLKCICRVCYIYYNAFKNPLSIDWRLIGFCLFHFYFLIKKMLDTNPIEIQCRIFFSCFQSHIHNFQLNNVQIQHDFLGHLCTKANLKGCANLYGIHQNLTPQIWFPQPDQYRRKRNTSPLSASYFMGNVHW